MKVLKKLADRIGGWFKALTTHILDEALVATTPPIVAAARTRVQATWEAAEWAVRARSAHVRLDTLERLAYGLSRADVFDHASAIWDDYIDGRREDERFGRPSASMLTEQASIFARVYPHIGEREAIALARAAWGTDIFQTYTRTSEGTINGRLSWFWGDTLIVRTITPLTARLPLSLHPVFTGSPA